jgi:hypothetical protein
VKNLAPQDGEPDTEIIHAKFVIGADGKVTIEHNFSCHRILMRTRSLKYRCTFMGTKDSRH